MIKIEALHWFPQQLDSLLQEQARWLLPQLQLLPHLQAKKNN